MLTSCPLQVRCDAASLGVPCTNCVAFSIECRIPTPKRKKTAAQSTTTAPSKDSDRYMLFLLEFYSFLSSSLLFLPTASPLLPVLITCNHLGLQTADRIPVSEETPKTGRRARPVQTTPSRLEPDLRRPTIPRRGHRPHLSTSRNRRKGKSTTMQPWPTT